MNNQFGLNQKTIAAIQHQLSTFPEIQSAILYGSRAKGTHKHGSDIDLTLIMTDKEQNPPSITNIAMTLDELDLPYSFDISDYRRITNSDLIDHIERVGIVFYEKTSKKLINQP